MNCMAIRPIFAGFLAAAVLVACGSNATDSNSAAPAENSPVQSSSLASFVDSNICNIVSTEALNKLFSPQSEVKTTAHVYKRRHSVSCTYSWPRPDAEARKEAMMKAMVDRIKQGGKGPNPSSSKFALTYSIRVSVRDSQASPQTFVPRKLSEEELQARIDKANTIARKRMTEKQRQVADKAGLGDMAGHFLHAANEREVVDGIGDAAYWSPVGKGSLNVLSGQKTLVISPRIADGKAGNLDVAKKIYVAIMN